MNPGNTSAVATPLVPRPAVRVSYPSPRFPASHRSRCEYIRHKGSRLSVRAGVTMKQIIACTCGFVILLFGAIEAGRADQDSPSGLADTTQTDAFPGGELRVVTDHEDVQPFPLKHTEVYAEISGNVAQVRVTQVFQNPYDRAIEAVYVFPLPDKSAVDDMVIRVGDRTIRGDIKKREEAREIYDQARRTGRTAALLDQERPNIFTQSVANILPGEEVIVSIRYFDLLPY